MKTTILDHLQNHALRQPEAQAFTFIDENQQEHTLSFKELDDEAQRIAAGLLSTTDAGDRAILLFAPGLDYIKAFFGCLYAQVVAVPLYPPRSEKHTDRVAVVMENCQARQALTSGKEYAQISTLNIHDFPESDNPTLANPEPENLAFLQYTSGSTGAPKGVMVNHHNIVANLHSLQEATECTSQDIFCNWLPLFHDLGLVNTILLPVFLGCHSVLMAPAHFIRRPRIWFEAITRHHATIAGAPNFAFDHCSEKIQPDATYDLSSWRVAFNAAEPIDGQTLSRFSQKFAECGFENSAFYPSYGMAEATVFIAGGSPQKAPVFAQGSSKQSLVGCGKVQSKHDLKIVNPETQEEVSERQVGEIWFSGPSVAQGYWQDEEKTKASFGFQCKGDSENRFLRTGDLGLVRGGELFISGRIKDVLIVKGRNHYPQDLEKLSFQAHPGLRAWGTVAFGITQNSEEQVIVVQEVDRRSARSMDFEAASAAIRTCIFEEHEIMVSSILFIRAGKLPRTSSGKVQRQLTKALFQENQLEVLFQSDQQAAPTQDFEAPASPIEQELALIWQDLLGLEQVGRHDHFFALGGHSLMVTRLVSKIQQEWKILLDLSALFEHPTLAQLATLVQSQDVALPVQSIPRQEQRAQAPATRIQQRMWFFDQWSEGQFQNNLSQAVRWKGPFHQNAWQKALEALVQRHEPLRTAFESVEGELFQTIAASGLAPYSRIDLFHLRQDEQQHSLEAMIKSEAKQAFDLDKAPLFRVRSYGLSPDEQVVQFTLHHSIADGWSESILIQDLCILYHAALAGMESPLPPLERSYQDFAQWQTQAEKNDAHQECLNYWQQQLTDLPPTHRLPLDRPRPSQPTFAASHLTRALAASDVESLDQACVSWKVTRFMALQTLFSILLHRYSNPSEGLAEDIVMGTTMAGRQHPDTESMVGSFINTPVLRSNLSNNPRFLELLEQNKSMILQAHRHQNIPFEELKTEQNRNHNDLFQIMFIVQNNEQSQWKIADVSTEAWEVPPHESNFDLDLRVLENDQGLSFEWIYNTDLFAQSSIGQMADSFLVLLQSALSGPEKKVDDLALMSSQQMDQLLSWGKGQKEDHGQGLEQQDQTFQAPFETHAEEYPNDMALIVTGENSKTEEWSYGELNRRANRMAKYLRAQGVTTESIVGLCVERSVALIEGVLGILKAGGAYVVIDPSYPQERIAHIVQDSNMVGLLTQSAFTAGLTPIVEPTQTPLILWNEQADYPQSEQLPETEVSIQPADLAALIYTSGSTGAPKGVMLEHRNLSSYRMAAHSDYGFPTAPRCLGLAAPTFDIFIEEWALSLLAGGTLVLVQEGLSLAAEQLWNLLEKFEVSALTLPTAYWSQVTQSLSPQAVKIIQTHLKGCIVGGEELSLHSLRQWQAQVGTTVPLWNTYGPTETSVIASLVDVNDHISMLPPPIGKALSSAELFVLDQAGQLVPQGVEGELHIGGKGVARGYWNQPDLTADKFVCPDFKKHEPHSTARLYKTGDVVRWQSDGNLAFVGRRDHQVKLRGFRIEMGEIENQLNQQAVVQESVVLDLNEGNEKRLVAFVVPQVEENEKVQPSIQGDFQLQVERTPERVAVLIGSGQGVDESFTYFELNRRANRLAHHLLEQGVVPETLIGLCVERSLEMMVGLLGILKAGAAYLPLDPHYPAKRLQHMVQDSKINWIISHSTIQQKLTFSGPTSICMDTFDWDSPAHPESNPQHQGDWTHRLAYTIYTSGSTGYPKGVMIEHGAVLNFFQGMADRVDLSGGTWLAVTSFSFDISVLELLGTLTQGFTVVLAQASQVSRGNTSIAHLLKLHAPTHLQCTPSLLAMLLEEQEGRAGIAGLKNLLVGGEPFPPQMIQTLAPLTQANIFNVYGPTETTIWSLMHALDSNEMDHRQDSENVAVPIGTPILNTQIHIVDEKGQEVPTGHAGELWIGGAGLARGYWDRPELTQEKFLVNPFVEKSDQNKRLYKTGDRVRRMPEGHIHFLGRMDQQVKIRGHRIELGEIESHLAQYSEVESAVVVSHSHLVAYLKLKQDEKLLNNYSPIQSIRQQLKNDLPDFMCPSQFLLVDQFPLTPNGKVDRVAIQNWKLPKTDVERSPEQPYVAPRNEKETSLCLLWQEVLTLKKAGIQDDFFAMGGDSFSGSQLIGRLRQVFDVEVPLNALFECPTVAEMVDRLELENGKSALPPLQVLDDGAHFPLSYAQQRLWFIDQLQGSVPYHLPLLFKIEEMLDLEHLQQALNTLISRHACLRTRFETIQGEVQQVIVPDCQVPFQVHQSAEWQTGVAAELKKPFDLSKDVLLRASVWVISETDFRLLLNVHHIASDGWSLDLLLEELSGLYRDHSKGQEPIFQPSSVRYPDFAQWQRNWMQGKVLQDHLAYWTEQLSGIPAVHQLPLDYARPAVQCFEGKRWLQTIEGDLLEKFKSVCQKHKATLFMGLQTAFAILLARYSAEQDIVMGVPVSGRPHPELEKMQGFFVNTVVLRTDFSDNPSFSTLLEGNKQNLLQALEHQHLPLDLLVEALQPERSLSHNPLFQILFVMQPEAPKPLTLAGGQCESIAIENPTVQFDLSLDVVETAQGLKLEWVYNTDLFKSQSIQHMANNFVILLQSVVQHPEQKVSHLEILSPAEKIQLETLASLPQGTDSEEGSIFCIHEHFEQQVVRTPNAPAIVQGTRGSEEMDLLSYASLNQQANQLAHHLMDQGIQVGDLVAICLPRGFEMVISILATLKVGAAYVPLDPKYPESRLQHIVEDSQCKLVLCHSDFRALLGTAPLLELDSEQTQASLIEKGTENPHVSAVTPQHLSHVIYTSGSTGQPKGVMIEHRNVDALLRWSHGQFDEQEMKLVLASTSVCFDLSVFELWAPLSRGGAVLLVDTVLSLVENSKLQPSLINTVPSALQALLDQDYDFSGVKTVNLAGEALPLELVQTLYRSSSVQKIYNLYGPSEDTTYSTFALMPRDLKTTPLIGRGIGQTQLLVMHEEQLAPLGAMGELFLGGSGVARGYLNQDELTALRFLPHPFLPDAQIYKTGDLVRWQMDEQGQVSQLEYLGRTDHQVKVRGFRIELGEVENALSRIDSVKVATVVVGGKSQQHLQAFVVLREEEQSSDEWADRLREEMKTQVPDYMIPASFVVLEKLPLTPNGKVDRVGLQHMMEQEKFKTSKYQAPRNLIEQNLCDLWLSVFQSSGLPVQWVGIHNNFFQLGGHSLLATRLISTIRRDLDMDLPLRYLFTHPTVAELAKVITQASETKEDSILCLEDRTQLPLSYAQQRLWFLDQLEEGSTHYNMLSHLSWNGPLNLGALHRTLVTLMQRHEVLRSTYEERGSQVFQVVAPESYAEKMQWNVHDLSDLDPTEQAEELKRQMALEQAKPFDLSQDLMMRAQVLSRSESRHDLLLNCHHIACDAWSQEVMAQEISTLYPQFCAQSSPTLPPLSRQYADFAHWQRSWMEGARLVNEMDYWKNQLAHLPQVHSLPLDHSRPAEQRYQGQTHELLLEPEAMPKVQAICAEHGVTPFMVFQTAFSIFLGQLSEETDIVVGSPIAGRQRHELEPLIGFFLNTLVLRTDLSHGGTFLDLLEQNKRTILEAYAHQHTPFEMLVEAVQPERNLSHHPLFQIMLVLHNPAPALWNIPEVQIEEKEASSESSKFDLTLTLEQEGDCWKTSWEYNTDLFQAQSVDEWATGFALLLNQLLDEPQKIVLGLASVSQSKTIHIPDQKKNPWVQPRTLQEVQMVALWTKVLEDAEIPVESIGIHDNFFHLGGHSLLATRLVSAIRQEMKATVPLRSIFDHPTVESLCSVVVENEHKNGPMVQVNRDEELTQSRAQQRFWFLDQLHGGSPQYNLVQAFEWEGPLQVEVLRQALESLMERQQILRTHLSTKNGQKIQVVLSDYFPPLQTLDLSPLNAEQQDEKIKEQVSEDYRHTFDLGRRVAWRMRVLVLGPEHHVLLWNVHHSIADGWSLGLLLEELTALYSAHLCSQTPDLPELPLQYADYAAWEQKAGEEAHWDKALNYWMSQLQGLPEVHQLPLDFPRPERQSFRGKTHLQRIDVERNHGLQAFGKQHDLTLFMTLQSAFALTLSRVSGQNEMVMGFPIAGRTEKDWESLVGCFVNTLILRTDFSDSSENSNFLDLLDSNKRTILDAYAFQELPFDVLVEKLNPPRTSRYNPLFQVLIVLQNQAPLKAQWSEGQISLLPTEDETTLFDLVLNVVEDQGALNLHWHYNTDLFEEATIQAWSNDFAHLLEAMVWTPQLPLNALPPFQGSGAPKKMILEQADLPTSETNGIPQSSTVHALISIWQDVLGEEGLEVDDLETNDDFFDLGGHSLLAISLASSIRESMQVEMPLEDIFDHSTLAEMALLIESLKSHKQGKLLSPPPIQAGALSHHYPLSFAQQRLWFIEQLEKDSHHYNLFSAFHLVGPFHQKAFQKAVQTVFNRHDALRTRFGMENGVAHQWFEEGMLPLLESDLSSMSHDMQWMEVNQRIFANEQQAFDLENDSLFRVEVFHLTPQSHVLLLNLHHIISDGWSMDVLAKEISLHYRAFQQHLEPHAKELPIQYADYVQWQQDWITGEVREHLLDYWKKRLLGIPTVHALPLDHPRPTSQSFAGALHVQSIEGARLAHIKDFCAQHNVTLFMFMQTAFSVLLGRYSNETDIVMGSPVAGRSHKAVEPLIGLFVNTLVLRSDLTGNPSFVSLLEGHRTHVLKDFEHQHLPFDLLVDALQPERNLSHSPLFQILFGFQKKILDRVWDLPGISTSSIEQTARVAKFDLSLNLLEGDDSLELEWAYKTTLFEPATLQRWSDNFLNLIEGILNNPDQTIQELPLMGEAEQRQVQIWSNRIPVQQIDTSDQCWHLGFESQAHRCPEQTAVVFDNGVGQIQSLSYGELNASANRLAHFLREQGVGPDGLVALFLERSLEQVVGILAILKAGGAFVPLDPETPQQRLGFLLEDSGVSWLLSQTSNLERLPESECTVFCLDDPSFQKQLVEFPEHNLSPEAIGLSSRHLAYLIYTSGSTGTPKGVVVEHRSLHNLSSNLTRLLGGTEAVEKCRWACNASYTFDASLKSLSQLAQGASLFLMSDSIRQDPNSLIEYIKNHKITHLDCTPSQLKMLLETDFDLPHLLIGGEAIGADLWQRLIELQQAQQKLFLNVYGPTEACVDALCCAIEPQTPQEQLGTFLEGVSGHVFNSALQPTPLGAIGELYLGGLGLARGYHRRPELTREKFVDHPTIPGERLYKTGDLIRRHSNGRLEFVGRVDRQVKLRGFRLELDEVEAQLRSLPRVEEAAVVLQGNGEKALLVAYLTGLPKAVETWIYSIRSELRKHLPEAATPSIFVPLETLPLTTHGKIDYRALPEPAEEEWPQSNTVAPRNHQEEVLCQLWLKTLTHGGRPLSQVGIHDSFFELGGHSLLATRLVSAIRKEFAVDLPLRALFESPTVAELAQRMEETPFEAFQTKIPVRRSDQKAVMSYAQQRLWIIHQMQGPSSQYNMPSHFRFSGTLNEQALEKSLEALLSRHEVLRTCFPEVAGKAEVQVLSLAQVKAQHSTFTPIDLSTWGAMDQQKEVQTLVEQNEKYCFELTKEPGFRCQLLKLSNTEHLLLLNFHHIVSDGWSMGIWMTEWDELYRAFHNQTPSPLSDLPIQYLDFAQWQRNRLQDGTEEKLLAYWTEKLHNLPPDSPWPLDHARPAQPSFMGKLQHLDLDSGLEDCLLQLCRSEGVTLFELLQTAFSVLMARYCQTTDVVMGTPMAGRTHQETEGLMGLFVNSVVLRSNLEGDPDFLSLLQGNQQMLQDAQAHQDLPFDLLVETLNPVRHLDQSPLFQVMFVLQEDSPRSLQWPGLTVDAVESDFFQVKFDLTVGASVSPEGLKLGCSYRSDLFDDQSMETLLEHFVGLLKSILDHPSQPISQLPPVLEGAFQKRQADQKSESEEQARWLEGIQAELKMHLPLYMCPSAYLIVDVIPLTSHGKVDKAALRQMAEDFQFSANEAVEYVAPRNAMEEQLCALWKKVLEEGTQRVDSIGIHDNFFDRGGHSLLVIRLVSLIRETLDIEVPVRILFEKPTVADFSSWFTIYHALENNDRFLEEADDMEEDFI